eukprot:gene8806-60457_t
MVLCQGCGVRIPANQLVGHASQCNRLNAQGNESARSSINSLNSSHDRMSLSSVPSRNSANIGSGSRHPAPNLLRRTISVQRRRLSAPGAGGAGGRDSLTSAYSLFIARYLDGAKEKKEERVRHGDAVARNRAAKESLLSRMSGAAAKWESMSEQEKAPYFAEAERNRAGGPAGGPHPRLGIGKPGSPTQFGMGGRAPTPSPPPAGRSADSSLVNLANADSSLNNLRSPHVLGAPHRGEEGGGRW